MPIDFSKAPTSVFWDVEDFPPPADRNLDWFYRHIKEALRNSGYGGDVSIIAYGEEKPEEEVHRYTDAGITFVPKGPKYWRLSYMLSDIGLWKLNLPDPFFNPTNLMVISKNVTFKRTPFVGLLRHLGYSKVNVLLVVPEDYLPELGPVPIMVLIWYWEKLLEGEPPMTWSDMKNLRDRTAHFGYEIAHTHSYW